ncbi:hypothetical protein ACFL1R_08670 [Candidatus Latescibacterota bacterium]
MGRPYLRFDGCFSGWVRVKSAGPDRTRSRVFEHEEHVPVRDPGVQPDGWQSTLAPDRPGGISS